MRVLEREVAKTQRNAMEALAPHLPTAIPVSELVKIAGHG